MTIKDYVFTSESVSEGHPDKIADQVSDSVLDAMLAGDRSSRVAVETMCMTGLVVVGGEVTSKSVVDIPELVRSVIKDIGYNDSEMGFDFRSCGILNCVNKQSPDIAMGVNKEDMGAGDQGMMFGYAVDETPELMPMPISYAHQLMRRLAEVRKNGTLPFLRPDGKGQVTVRYENYRPVEVSTVVLSAQHSPEVTNAKIREALIEEVIKKVIPAQQLAKDVVYHINPTGRFVVGGPHGDTGLTGRKIIVDTYGGMGRHGGGAFSGKDPSKVDRSAAYMARYIAKNVVASGAAARCEVQLAYAIGVASPVSVLVDTFGTGAVEEARLSEAVRKIFPMTPRGIIEHFDLTRPIYRQTASGGHFGRAEFPWERTSKAVELAGLLGIKPKAANG
ncbi:MAG: methionine adenosyltransferase [Deltaproteobacteria bacterium]|nr:methionine adenosyltransferase [Deltaproteobacteria bacterium]